MGNFYIVGASHTGITLAKRIREKMTDASVVLCDTIQTPDRSVEDVYKQSMFKDDLVPHADLRMSNKAWTFFVTYDDDSINVKLCMELSKEHPDSKIYAILTQDTLGSKMRTIVPNLTYINPARIAADKFVECALKDIADVPEQKFAWPKLRFKPDSITKKVLYFIASIITTSTLFFHFHDGLPIVDALYFTITMMATVGFGDYSLRDNGTLSKLFGCIIMLLSVTSVAMIIALASDSIVRRRKELSMGKSSYTGHNHVLVIGSGSVGYHVIKKLIEIGETPVVLDRSLDGRYSQQIVEMGVPHLIGDARDEQNLFRGGLGTCKALISVTQDDMTNLEVGLDAKTCRPDLRVVMRIYDRALASNMRVQANLRHTMSMSYIASDEFINMINQK